MKKKTQQLKAKPTVLSAISGTKKSEISDEKTQSPQLWKKEDAIAYLQIPYSTFNLHLAKGDIPHVRIGKHIRFIPEQLVAWVKKQTA
jgi:excisionase family DNA binding protein